MSQKRKNAKSIEKYKEIVEEPDGIFDVASDFQIFIEEYQKNAENTAKRLTSFRSRDII